MSNSNRIRIIIWIIVFISLLFVIRIVFFLPKKHNGIISELDIGSSPFETEIFTISNEALDVQKPMQSNSFVGAYTSPFSQRKNRTRKRIHHVSNTNNVVNIKLYLKGILNKTSALAIIEDEYKKSFICKKGDTVHEWKIIKIGTESVTLKSGNITHELRVNSAK